MVLTIKSELKTPRYLGKFGILELCGNFDNDSSFNEAGRDSELYNQAVTYMDDIRSKADSIAYYVKDASVHGSHSARFFTYGISKFGKGHCAIVGENQRLREVLKMFRLDSGIEFYESEKEFELSLGLCKTLPA